MQVHLIAKDMPNCLHIRAGDLVDRTTDEFMCARLFACARVLVRMRAFLRSCVRMRVCEM